MKLCAPVSLVLVLACAPLTMAQSYPASGMVLRADSVHRSLDVSCQAISGYSESQVQKLRVRDAHDLATLEPGMLIDFILHVEKPTSYAEQIRINKFENTAQEPMAARQLEILDSVTHAPLASSRLHLGDLVPDFALLNQSSQKVTLSEFRGKLVVLTFIYTRCPLPNFCFRMSNNFGALHRAFTDHMGKDLVLLSITFDPEHDQPQALAEYARTWTDDPKGWHFLTGSTADVHKICQEFGITAWQDEGLMTHSLRTVVVDRQGRVAANLEGNDYSAHQLTDLIEFLMNGSRPPI